MHQNTTKYTIKDLKKYRNVILLRMKLEGLDHQRNLSINIDFIEHTLKYPEDPKRFLSPKEVEILYKYYKSYLPKLNRKELINLLGYSTKLSIFRPIADLLNTKVYIKKTKN